MSWSGELSNLVAGQVLTDDTARDAAATDFGRLFVRKPAAVVRPSTAADVAETVKFAGRNGLKVSTRGGGHSQSGQSLSNDIVLDMTSLAGVKTVEEFNATCGGGIKWRALVEHLAPQRLSPPVLTNNLDVTVGGTLSTGGLGVASWRHGTQADNCLELEVVTGAGEIVRCSADQDRDLFDAVRAGMGQFGVITEAKLKLRRYQPRYRSFYLLYDNLSFLLKDLETLMNEERFDYLESWCAPCAQGIRKVGGGRTPFAQWFFPLHATLETDGENLPEAATKLSGLKFYKHVHTEDGEIGEFFARLDTVFDLWRRGGAWDFTHPWMECVLPWNTTPMYINRVLENFPPQAVVGGHILLWPGRGAASTVPMFMKPSSELVMGFGILPAFPKHLVEEPLKHLGMASAGATMMGGKRYLSGWINFDHNQWKAHYGDTWPKVVELKKKFDPQGILNSGFVRYEP
jgi:FAD/FMN-containing dehydrogenase